MVKLNIGRKVYSNYRVLHGVKMFGQKLIIEYLGLILSHLLLSSMKNEMFNFSYVCLACVRVFLTC